MTKNKKSSVSVLALGALGIVFGDIGTSVLYAFKEVFVSGHVRPTEANILGILSLFFWALTIIVSIKYVVLIMRADNNGEGGLMALLALASMSTKNAPKMRLILVFMGVFGVALFFGDGIITPAMSVLSAVEGLKAVTPHFEPYVVPITLLILAVLFFFQRRGTHEIGKFFGPVMLLWFVTIGVLGLVHVFHNPVVLKAFYPGYALAFLWNHMGIAFITLGAVFLCLTGAEALYADMGHFGKAPIRMAWFFVAMPALVFNYFGQGALVLRDPSSLDNPFINLAPSWLQLPLVLLATLAAVIASQALITGAFSAVRQTIQLGFLPRLTILHTSIKDLGQIYVPVVNWILAVGVFAAVALFGSSSAMAAAYGISVSLLMMITTLMTFFVVRYEWRYPLWITILSTGIFFLIDSTFVTSNSLKFMDGGWFPLLIAVCFFIVMSTWNKGQHLLRERRLSNSLDLSSFLESVFENPPARVEGTAIYLASDIHVAPNAMLHNLKHNKVIHTTNLFVTVRNHEVPWVGMNKRLEIEALGHDCWQVVVHFGFKNDPDLPQALELISGRGIELDPMNTSYFLSRDSIVSGNAQGMAKWRKKLFSQMYRNASSAADFLNLPSNAVVELGAKVEI